MTPEEYRDFTYEHRALIAVAEAAWRGSASWHVFDWMCWKMRLKYFRMPSQFINWDAQT